MHLGFGFYHHSLAHILGDSDLERLHKIVCSLRELVIVIMQVIFGLNCLWFDLVIFIMGFTVMGSHCLYPCCREVNHFSEVFWVVWRQCT